MMDGLRYLLEPTKLIVLLLLASLFTFSCSLAELSEVEEAENIATPTATEIPVPTQTPTPTPEPTAIPTPVAILEPTAIPTPIATPEPTPIATPEPTPIATPEPTPVATPEPTPIATPEPEVVLPVDEADPEFYGPKLTALSIDNTGDSVSFSLEADTYASSMSEANLFIKNPNGEIQGIGCAPFFILEGTAKGCTLNLQSQDDFWSPIGTYSWERLTLKNSYGAQSSYWGDGRLQKGKSAPIENNAHEFTSEKISFEKLFILKEPVNIDTTNLSGLQLVDFESKESIESSIESLSTSIDITLYTPAPVEKTAAELQAEEEASLEIETAPELEVIPQAGANSGSSEQSHLLYAGTGITDPYVYTLAAPNEDGKLRKTKSIAGPHPVTGIWTGSLGASEIMGDSSQYAGNTHYSWKPIEENWPADLEFDDKCQWTTCIRLNDNSFLTTSEYTDATLDRRPINFGDTVTEYVKRSWGGGSASPRANSFTFTGTKGQYFEIDVSVPENSNTRPDLELSLADSSPGKQFYFNESKLPGGPSNTNSLDREDWDGELKLGTEFSKGFIGTLPEDGTYNITVITKGPDVNLPNWLKVFQLGADIDDTGTSVNINTMQNIVEFAENRNLELVGSMMTINQEIFKVTEVVNNNTVTADRAQDGTFAQNHNKWNKASILIGTKTERHFTPNQYGEKITVSLSEGGVRVVKPVAPTSISTEAGVGSVKVTWSAPTMDIEGRSNPIIDSYTIGARTKETHSTLESRANNPGITVTVGSDATSATLNGLTNGLRYYIYVTANNEKGSSSEAYVGGSKTVIPSKPSPFSAYANTVNWDNTGQATYLRETKFLCPGPDIPGSLKDFCDPEENGPQTYSVDCGTPLTTIMNPNSVRRSLVGYDGQPIDFSWDMNANSMHGTSRVPGKVGQDLLLNYSLYPNSIPSYAGCVNSEITVDGEIDEWPFEGKAGQWVEITMDPKYFGDKWSYRPNLDKLIPILELVAPNPPPGSVPFSKSVDQGVPVEEDISCYAGYCSSGEIYPGETKGGYISNLRSTDIWKFEAIAGEKYNIVIEFNPNLGIASEQRYGKNFDTGMPLTTKEYHLKHGPLMTYIYGTPPDPLECWPLNGTFGDENAECPKRKNGTTLGGPQSIFMWANNNSRREYNSIEIKETGSQMIHISANSSWEGRDCSDPCPSDSRFYDGAGFPVYQVSLTKVADAPEVWNERPNTISLDLLQAGYTGEIIEYDQTIDTDFEFNGEVDSYHFYGRAGESISAMLTPTLTKIEFFDRFAVNGEENELDKSVDCLKIATYENERRDAEGKIIHDGSAWMYQQENPCMQTILQLISPSGTLEGYNSGPQMEYSGNVWPSPSGIIHRNAACINLGCSSLGEGRPIQLKETGWYTLKSRAIDVQIFEDLSFESSGVINTYGSSTHPSTGKYSISLKQKSSYLAPSKSAQQYTNGLQPKYAEDYSGTICPRSVHAPNTSYDIAKGVAITPHDNCVAFAQNTLSYFGNPINQPLVIRHRLTQDGTYIIRARGAAGKASVWDGRVEAGNTGTYRLSLSLGDFAPQDDPDYGKIFHTPNENIDLWKLTGQSSDYVCPWTESCHLWDAKLPVWKGLQPVGNTSQYIYGKALYENKPGQLITYPIHTTPIPISMGEAVEVSFNAPGCESLPDGSAYIRSQSGCYKFKVPTKGYDIQYPDDVFEPTYQGYEGCIQCFLHGGYLSFEGVKGNTINLEAIWNQPNTENPTLELISPSLRSEVIDYSGSTMNWKTKEGKVISIIESHTLMETGTYRIKLVNSGHNYEESMDHGPILATIRLS